MIPPLLTGDPVIVCGIGPQEIPVRAIVRVEHAYGEQLHFADTAEGYFVRQILSSSEGRVWVRGHDDDAMAALLLVRSAR